MYSTWLIVFEVDYGGCFF